MPLTLVRTPIARLRARLRIVLVVLATSIVAAMTATPAQPVTFARSLWLTPAEVAALPTSGPAWSALRSAADGPLGTPNISDQDSNHDINTLAVALVYARTGESSYRTKAAQAISAAIGTEAGGRTLALGRNLVSYVIAADLIDLPQYDPALEARFRSWLSAVRSANLSGNTLISTHERRANNWGTNAGASRVAADLYLRDMTDLARAVRVFRGWIGDRSQYAAFSFGDLSWQADPSKPVGINPKGATKNGYNIDGVLPDDQRRAGGFTWPAPRENYVWGALGPAVVTAELLRRAGYSDAPSWSDSALQRALTWLHDVNDFPASGDDTWVPWLANRLLGTSYPTALGSKGKSMAWTDWTHGSGGTTSSGSTSSGSSSSSGSGGSTTNTGTGSSTNTGTGSSTNTGTGSSTTNTGSTGLTSGRVLKAVADATVDSAEPTRNFGRSTTLRARGDAPIRRTYVTFTVTDLTAAPAGAKLRLYVTDDSNGTIEIEQVAGEWSETGINWNNAPALSGVAIASATPTAGWIEINLGSAIAGNGTYTFVITTRSTNGAKFASRETSSGPVLVLG